MPIDVTLRGVDGELYRELKAHAAKHALRVSDAANEAFRYWLVHHEEQKPRIENALRYLAEHARDWGPGTERASMEVDEVLYGWKKHGGVSGHKPSRSGFSRK